MFGEASDEREQLLEFAAQRHPEAELSAIESIVDKMMLNPRIRLDSGQVVWGAQCWWGSEEKVKAEIGGRTVIMVDLDKANEEAKNAGN